MHRTLFTGLAVLVSAASARGVMAGPMKGHATTFTVRIENVSTTETLKSMNGATAPAPNSPGLWVVHRGAAPVFASGKLDRGQGLEIDRKSVV